MKPTEVYPGIYRWMASSSNATAAAAAPRRAKTRTGKSLIDTQASDLYALNSAPPRSILKTAAGSPSTQFTDEQGRIWSYVTPGNTRFKWTRAQTVYESLDFNPKTDRVFFIREKGHLILTVGDTVVLHGTAGGTLTGTIRSTGADEPGARPGQPLTRSRKTTFAVLSDCKTTAGD